MDNFPDDRHMERSADGSEIIRGGSVGLNRILNAYVARAAQGIRPAHSGVIISAFTVFRNVWDMKEHDPKKIDVGFITDVSLFLDYHDTYLSKTMTNFEKTKWVPVLVYFPDYSKIKKTLLRDLGPGAEDMMKAYKLFLKRALDGDGTIKEMAHSKCQFVSATSEVFPFREVADKFRKFASQRDSLYTSGNKVGVLSSMPIDYYLMLRVRNIELIESYTGLLKDPRDFGRKLDKKGNLPFNPTTHAIFGDAVLIKPFVTGKDRKELLEEAEKDRWFSKSEGDIRSRIARKLKIPMGQLPSFGF